MTDFTQMQHPDLVKCPVCGLNGRQEIRRKYFGKETNAVQILGGRIDHKTSELIPGFCESIDEHCNFDAALSVDVVVLTGRY